MPLAAGTRLGPYEILSPLGAGGMGEVYRARDSRLGRDVAVKVLPDHLAADPKALARFETEAKAVAALSHPNILALYDVGETNGVRYAVTELLEGETLRALVTGGPVPLWRALEIARHVADALAAAHEKGIVHRDVKPENVFLTKDGHVKLLDFGLARLQAVPSGALDTRSPTVPVLTESGSILGTVAYMPPEQARGQAVDHRTDQFSLGVTLYEMLSGKRPFRGEDAASLVSAILRDEPEPLATAAPSAPVGVRLVVERCLAKDPRERYASTRDLARDLAAWREHASGTPVSGGPPSEVPVSAPTGALSTAGRSPTARRRLVTGLVVGALALAASFGSWLWMRRQGEEDAERSAVRESPTAATPGLLPQRVVVAVFANRTGDPSLDAIGRTAAERIVDRLVRVGADVVPAPHALPAEGAPSGSPARAHSASSAATDPAVALGEATRAGLVVSGSCSLQGTQLELRATVTDAAARKVLYSVEQASGPRSDPSAALAALAQRALDALGERLLAPESGADISSRQIVPPRYEALAEYLLAAEAMSKGDMESHIEHLRKAVELDPAFTNALLGLYAAYAVKLDWPEATRWIEAGEKTRAGLTPIGRLNLDVYSADFRGQVEAGIRALRELARLEPSRPVHRFILGRFLSLASRAREAEQILSPLFANESFVSLGALGAVHMISVFTGALHGLGEHERELAVARRGVRLYPDDVQPWICEARALSALGRLSELDALVERAPATAFRRGNLGWLYLEAARDLDAHGRGEASVAMSERAVAWGRERAAAGEGEQRKVVLALGLEIAGHVPAARRELAALLAAKGADPGSTWGQWPYDAESADEVFLRGVLGGVEARLGNAAEARRLEEAIRKVDSPNLIGRGGYARSIVAASLGEKDRAVGLLKTALAEGLTMASISPTCFVLHRSFWHRSLRGHPGFEDLAKPKG